MKLRPYVLFNLVCIASTVLFWPWLGWFASVLFFLPEIGSWAFHTIEKETKKWNG